MNGIIRKAARNNIQHIFYDFVFTLRKKTKTKLATFKCSQSIFHQCGEVTIEKGNVQVLLFEVIKVISQL